MSACNSFWGCDHFHSTGRLEKMKNGFVSAFFDMFYKWLDIGIVSAENRNK